MEVIILEDMDAVARIGSHHICELIKKKPDAVLGLATGSTTIALYQKIIQRHQQDQISFRDVTTFNLDEYIGITTDNPQSYRSFMDRELFNRIDINNANTHVPSCGADENPLTVSATYERTIADVGGIDLQVLGVGTNGHIGFNEPCSSLASRTRVKTLTQSTIRDNSHLFDSGEFQPHMAITMGIGTILESRRVILLAVGSHKAMAMRDAIEGPVAAKCQASALQMHEKVIFILDEAAASCLEYRDYFRWASKNRQ